MGPDQLSPLKRAGDFKDSLKCALYIQSRLLLYRRRGLSSDISRRPSERCKLFDTKYRHGSPQNCLVRGNPIYSDVSLNTSAPAYVRPLLAITECFIFMRIATISAYVGGPSTLNTPSGSRRVRVSKEHDFAHHISEFPIKY